MTDGRRPRRGPRATDDLVEVRPDGRVGPAAASPPTPFPPPDLPGQEDGLPAPNSRALSRTALFLILNTGLNGVLGIGFWAVGTRLFSREIVGASGSLISLMIFLAALSQFNLYQALPRFLQVFGSESRRLVRMSYLACSITAAIGATLVVAVCSVTHWGGVMGSLSPLLAVVFVVGTSAWTVFVLQDAVLTGLRRAPLVPLENLVFGVAKLGLLFVIGSGAGRGSIFFSWLLAVPIIAVPLNILLFRVLLPQHERATPSAPLDRNALRRSLGLEYASALFGQLSSNLLPVLVANILGSVANADFYSAWVIIAALDTVAQNFGISLTVEATRDPRHFRRYLRHAELRVAQMLVPTVVVLAAGAPVVLSLFGSTYSSSASGILRVLLLATAVRAIPILAIGMHRARGAIHDVLKMQATVGVSVLALSLLAMPHFGVIGVAWAYLAGNSVAAVVGLSDLHRQHRRTEDAMDSAAATT